jgi:hypothetical protein
VLRSCLGTRLPGMILILCLSVLIPEKNQHKVSELKPIFALWNFRFGLGWDLGGHSRLPGCVCTLLIFLKARCLLNHYLVGNPISKTDVSRTNSSTPNQMIEVQSYRIRYLPLRQTKLLLVLQVIPRQR